MSVPVLFEIVDLSEKLNDKAPAEPVAREGTRRVGALDHLSKILTPSFCLKPQLQLNTVLIAILKPFSESPGHLLTSRDK